MAHADIARDDHLLVVTMNRPRRKNAMTPAMVALLADAWQELTADDRLRCAILTGADGNFSSGADLRAMAGEVDPDDGTDGQARVERDPDLVWRGLLKTDRPTKPIIAAVEGVAIAGGTELLQGTDIRVAGESARFGVSEARWSIYPMGGSPVRLPRQIPYTVAADLLLTGRHIGAREAKAIGLISRVVPDGQALATAMEIAEVIASDASGATEAMVEFLHA
jgi:enoyl-CoA hydratase/carnithine racemase